VYFSMEWLICRYAFYPAQRNSTGVNIVLNVLQMYVSLHVYRIISCFQIKNLGITYLPNLNKPYKPKNPHLDMKIGQ
jgi:hypothetical protein